MSVDLRVHKAIFLSSSSLTLRISYTNMHYFVQTRLYMDTVYAYQVRQLLLDPAVNREFQRMHKALEDKSDEAQRLREELQGTTFQFDSKAGRMLVAKCRTLQVTQLQQ